MAKRFYTWKEFNEDIKNTVKTLLTDEFKHINKVYGIPKGGLIIAVALANHIPKLIYVHSLNDIDENTLIVDDISDSGETLLRIPNIRKYKTMCLFCKEKTRYQPTFWWNCCIHNEWVCFPWESTEKEEVRDGTEIL